MLAWIIIANAKSASIQIRQSGVATSGIANGIRPMKIQTRFVSASTI